MELQERTMAFPADPAALAGVRDFARQAAGDLGAHVDLDLLAVVVGELAANATMHQSGAARITVRRLPGGQLEVEVCDEDPALPELVHQDPWALGGHRGIQLVAALAEAWGVEPLDGHKRVWAQLPLLAAAPTPSTTERT